MSEGERIGRGEEGARRKGRKLRPFGGSCLAVRML